MTFVSRLSPPQLINKTAKPGLEGSSAISLHYSGNIQLVLVPIGSMICLRLVGRSRPRVFTALAYSLFFSFNLPHQNFLDYFPQVCRSFSTSFNRSRESSRMVKQLWRVCRSYGLRTPRMRTKTKLKYNYVNVRFWLLIEALFFYNLKTSLLSPLISIQM